LPDVLKNVSFSVLGHEKVAVVGRTGAGKSTLSLAFFRIIPFSSGSITIDGMNISELGLHDLRR
jgi:ABC-type multidrug transport system fused ATPase/permease subunit